MQDVHVMAVDQTVTTTEGVSPNMDIRMWAAKTVDGVHLALLHKIAEDVYRMESDWFGTLIFENLVEARDYIQEQMDNMSIN